MRRLNPTAEEGTKDIDISPLIDVVFILLIFFMVSTTFVKDAALDIERPGAGSASPAPAQTLRVAIDQQGQVYVDNVPVRPWMIQSRVREVLKTSGNDTVLVVTDRRVASEKLIDVVDQCRLAGAGNVGGCHHPPRDSVSGRSGLCAISGYVEHWPASSASRAFFVSWAL